MKYLAVIELSFHLGEIYFWAPFLWSATHFRKDRILLVSTKPGIARAIASDTLLSTIIRRRPVDLLEIDLSIVRLGRKYGRFISRITVAVQALRMKPLLRLWRAAKHCDLILTQINGGKIERLMRLRKRSFLTARFPHTSSPALFDINRARLRGMPTKANCTDPFIVYDRQSIKYYQLHGYSRFVVIGRYFLSSAWRKLMITLAEKSELSRSAVIFSYACREDTITFHDWERLHCDTVDALRRVFPDLTIVIKPHPNQSSRQLSSMINRNNWKKVIVSNENPWIIAGCATVAIGFLTAAIYNAIFLGVPAVNFFNSYDLYESRRGPAMQGYDRLGIPDVRSRDDLESFLWSVRSGTHQMPHFLSELRDEISVATFAELRDKIRELT